MVFIEFTNSNNKADDKFHDRIKWHAISITCHSMFCFLLAIIRYMKQKKYIWREYNNHYPRVIGRERTWKRWEKKTEENWSKSTETEYACQHTYLPSIIINVVITFKISFYANLSTLHQMFATLNSFHFNMTCRLIMYEFVCICQLQIYWPHH